MKLVQGGQGRTDVSIKEDGFLVSTILLLAVIGLLTSFLLGGCISPPPVVNGIPVFKGDKSVCKE